MIVSTMNSGGMTSFDAGSAVRIVKTETSALLGAREKKGREHMKKLLSMLLALALVLAMSVCAIAEEDWVKTPGEIEKWDREVDFLVVGYGLAGAAAAVEAHDIDPNAEILVLEKMPVELAGGNSIASGQFWRLITFILVPAVGGAGSSGFGLVTSVFLFAMTSFFYYWIGNTLERQMGTTRFTLFYLLGIVFNILFGLVPNF